MLQQTTHAVELDAKTRDATPRREAATHSGMQRHVGPLHEQPAPVIWEIEARVLAGQPDAVIADRLGLPTRVVTKYVTKHFNYRHGQGRNTWLFLYAVQGPLMRDEELTEGDIWRLVAWLYGPVGVDLIINDYHDRTHPENAEATVLAGLLRAQAVMRFVDPRTKVYAEANRLIRQHFSRRRNASAKQIIAGLKPTGKRRPTSKARGEHTDIQRCRPSTELVEDVPVSDSHDGTNSTHHTHLNSDTEDNDVATDRIARQLTRSNDGISAA